MNEHQSGVYSMLLVCFCKVVDPTTCFHVTLAQSAVDQLEFVSISPIHSPPACTCLAPLKFYWQVICYLLVYCNIYCRFDFLPTTLVVQIE